MPPKSRKQAKVTASSGAASKSSIPAPFSKPDSGIASFLDYLNTEHVYISHIDRTSRLLKRNTFFQVLALNIGIVGLLAWRAWYMGPYYGALIMTFVGNDSPLKVDTQNATLLELADLVVRRSGTLFVDFAIFRLLGPWPWTFFVGQTSPSFWRSSVGFQTTEVTIRRSRTWDQDLAKDWIRHQEQGDGKEVFDERIMPAIHKDYIRTKTGYLMQDKSWDLDFPAMVMAQHLVDTKKNTLQDFEKTVIVHTEQFGWIVWPVYKLDEGVDDGQRQKLMLFKDKLTRMGKENLFFRWIEIIQFESSQPGGFNEKRQVAAMKQVKELFESQDIDFESFCEEVGGLEGLPGWDR